MQMRPAHVRMRKHMHAPLLRLINFYQVPRSYVKEIGEIAEGKGEIAREMAPVPAADNYLGASSADAYVRSSSVPSARDGASFYYPLTSSSVPPNRCGGAVA